MSFLQFMGSLRHFYNGRSGVNGRERGHAGGAMPEGIRIELRNAKTISAASGHSLALGPAILRTSGLTRCNQVRNFSGFSVLLACSDRFTASVCRFCSPLAKIIAATSTTMNGRRRAWQHSAVNAVPRDWPGPVKIRVASASFTFSLVRC